MAFEANSGLVHATCGSVGLFILDDEQPVFSSQHRSVSKSLGPALSSNDAPDPVTTYLVNAWQASFDAPIKQLEDAVSVMEAQLATLKARTVAMARQRKRFNGVFSATRRFPLEILSEIFLHVMNSTGEKSYDIFDLEDYPWLFTRVSSQWRAAALSCSALWAFPIQLDMQDAKYLRNPAKLAECALTRAGIHRGLYITIMIGDTRLLGWDFVSVLFDVVCSRSQQWERFTLRGARIYYLTLQPLTAISGKVPRLRFLSVEVTGSFWDFCFLPPVTCFEDSPMLREVEISCTNSNPLAQFSLPCSQIRTLGLTGPIMSLDPELIPFKSLESLQLFQRNVCMLPTFLPGIPSLAIVDTKLLHYIRPTKLEVLKIDGSREPDFLVPSYEMIRRTCHSSFVTRLQLLDCELTGWDSSTIRTLCRSCLSLTELDIRFSSRVLLPVPSRREQDIDCDMLDLMKDLGEMTSSGVRYLPKLQKLAYYDYTTFIRAEWPSSAAFYRALRVRAGVLQTRVQFAMALSEASSPDAYRSEWAEHYRVLKQMVEEDGVTVDFRFIQRRKHMRVEDAHLV